MQSQSNTEITRLPLMSARFLTMKQVAEELAISDAQVYALVRNRELPAIKVGGRGQWRIERAKLEEYIERAYDDTARFIEMHPYTSTDRDLGDHEDNTPR